MNCRSLIHFAAEFTPANRVDIDIAPLLVAIGSPPKNALC